MSGDRAGQQGWRDGSTPPPVFAGQPIARQFEAGGLVPSAPRYLPTEEQFRDPLAFVAAIRAEAEPYGVCSIRPPPSWAPPYAIDRATFTFKTRLQCIHELYDRGGSGCQHWRAAYNKFLATSGLRHTKKQNPTLHGAVIDLAKLHRAVQRRGGYQAVIDAKKWKEVARIAGMMDLSTNAAYNLRHLYHSRLLPFDAWLDKHPKEHPEHLASKAKEEEPAKKKAKPASKEEEEEDDGRVPENIDTLLCDFCQGGHYEDQIILCDRCDHGFHLFCLSPPLEDVPEGDWVCPNCLAQDSDAYCFKEGQDCTLDEFEALANDFRQMYRANLATSLGKAEADVTWQDLELEFWRIVETAEEPVEVLYGADLDTGIYGSGFPLAPTSIDEREAHYSKHVWNINNFPTHGGRVPSLLRHIKDKIPGVMVPWMYVGMMYSAFCWHIEDHMFYSINYMHWGEAKRWYSVPAYATKAFEEAFHEWLPDQMAMQPDLLFQLVTLLSPEKLNQSGVPVYGVVQEARDYVVTFPCAYHGGFNTGFNCAEACNFCPPDWLRFGSASQERYRHFRRPPVLSLEEMVLKVASEERLSPEAAAWLAIELERISSDERALRSALWAKGVQRSLRITHHGGMLPGEETDQECSICHSILHYSALRCQHSKCGGGKGRLVCLHHSDQLCECHTSNHELLFRHTVAELEGVLVRVKALASESSTKPDWGLFRKSAVKILKAEPVKAEVGEHDMDTDAAVKAEAAPQPPTDAKPEATPAAEPKEAEVAVKLTPGGQGVRVALVVTPSAGTKRTREEMQAPCDADRFPKLTQTLAIRDMMLVDFISAPEVRVEEALEGKLEAAHQKWLAKSRGMLAAGRVKMSELDAAIRAGSGFTWGWCSLQEGEDVLEALRDAYAWGKTCQALCSKKSLLEEIEATTGRNPQPALVPGLKKLIENVAAAKELVPKLEVLQAQLGDKEAPPPTLSQLEQVVCDAVRNPNVEFPIARPLQELVRAANKWGNALRQTLPQLSAAASAKAAPPPKVPVTLEQLEALHAEGAALGVAMPQLEQLASLLARAKEWRAQAAAALTTPEGQTLEGLRAMRAAGPELPVELPELPGIVKLAGQAEAWEERAAAALADGADLEELQLLIDAAAALGVRLPGVAAVTAAANRCNWRGRIDDAAAGKELPLAELEQALADAAEAGDNSDAVQAATRKCASARAVRDKLKALLAELTAPCSELALAAVAAALDEAAAAGVLLPEAAAVQEHVSKCEAWEAATKAVLEPAGDAPRAKASVVDDLIMGAASIPFQLELEPRLHQRKQQMDAWAAKAEELLAQGCAADAAAVAEHLEGAARLGVEMAQEGALARTAAPGLLQHRMRRCLQAHSPQRPTEAEAEAWLAEGVSMGFDADLLGEWRAALAAAAAWSKKSAAALSCGRAAASRQSAEELRASVDEAAAMPVVPAGLEAVVTALEASKTWEEKTRVRVEAMQAEGGRRFTSAELDEIVEAGVAIPVASQRLNALYACVTATEDWAADLQDMLVPKGVLPRKGCRAKLDGLVGSLHRSAGAFAALLRRAVPGTELAPPCARKAARYGLVAHTLPEDLSSYCLCLEECPAGQEQRGGNQLISCDSCESKYHIKCVGVNPQTAKSLRKYTCHICSAIRMGCVDNEPVTGEEALARLRHTSRPELATLEDHLTAAQDLAVESKHEAELGSALLTLELATASASALVERHMLAMRSEAATEGALPEGALRLLLRAALSGEVNCVPLAERVLAAIRVARWRAKADALLAREEPATISVDNLSKLVRDGTALGLGSSCPLHVLLNHRLEMVRNWQGLVRRALASQPQHTETLRTLLQAGKHVAHAAKVDKLQQELAAAIKTYCYCQQTYDEERPMLSCDHCSEWYHYDCLGLPAPATPSGAGGPTEPVYRCPTCTVKAGAALSLEELPEAARRAVEAARRAVEAAQRATEPDKTPGDSPAHATAAEDTSESSDGGPMETEAAPTGGMAAAPPMQTGVLPDGLSASVVDSPVYRRPNCQPSGVTS